VISICMCSLKCSAKSHPKLGGLKLRSNLNVNQANPIVLHWISTLGRKIHPQPSTQQGAHASPLRTETHDEDGEETRMPNRCKNHFWALLVHVPIGGPLQSHQGRACFNTIPHDNVEGKKQMFIYFTLY